MESSVLPYITPRGLSKHVVGDSFKLTIQLNSRYFYTVRIRTNLNGKREVYAATYNNEVYTASIPLTESGFLKYEIDYQRTGAKSFKKLKDHKGLPVKGMVQIDPAWLNEAIAYCVFVRFFKGKVNPHNVEPRSGAITESFTPEMIKEKQVGKNALILPGDGGTFDDVKAHLSAIKKMHCNVLYFNPIHTIGEVYRGYNMMDQLPPYLQPGSPYSIKDYKSIDPELAYDKDNRSSLLSDPQQEFKELVDAAHEKGMYVILDLVFNHTAHDFVFQRMHPEWYLYKEHITSLEDPYLYPEDIERGLPWGDARHSMAPYDHGFFWEDTAQLNWEYKLPKAVNDPPPNYSLHDMWEFFKSIPQYWISRFGVDGFRCDVAYRIPPAFWKACIREARECARTTQANLAGDAVFIAESYTDDLDTLQETGFSSVYGDFSHKLRTPLELKGYLDYIYNISGDHFPNNSRWFHFPESHDFERAPRKVLPGPMIGTEKALLVNQSRWVLTATLPGIPLIFNGFEKIEWQPINIMSYGAINWDKEADLQQFIGKINFIRSQSVALEKGSYTYLPNNQGLNDITQIMTYLRQYKDEQVIVVVNMDVMKTAGPAIIHLPDTFKGPYRLSDLLTGTRFEREGTELVVELQPGQAHIFAVDHL